MKKLNQYLLENYPTIWNTKLVWMLLITLVLHIIFFSIGYVSHIDPTSLQTNSVRDDFFSHGYIFIQVTISIILIVGWLILMFKNNAFKNFYPNSKWKLFSQFSQYFVIVFASITFYYSFMMGFRTYIVTQYPDKEMKSNIDIINRSNAFLSSNTTNYTLDNRLYPKPLYDLYCETDINEIDRSKKYFVYYDRVYQFYTTYSKIVTKKNSNGEFLHTQPEYSKNVKPIGVEEIGKSEVSYYKKEVVDISSYISTTQPSYSNFSELFFDGIQIYNETRDLEYTSNDFNRVYTNENMELKLKKEEINRKTIELLNKNNPDEIEKLLSEFLNISKKYKISTNLTAKDWTKLVYHPNDFQVKKFIRQEKPNSTSDDSLEGIAEQATEAAYVDENGVVVDSDIKIETFNPTIANQTNPDLYYKQNLTSFYYYDRDLKNLLGNVEEIKEYNFFQDSIHIFLWISFGISLLVFSFRVAGLKALLFSIISSGVISLLVTMVSIGYSFLNDGYEESFTSIVGLIVLLAIMSVPLFMMNKFSKMITSIFVVISMNVFVPTIFLIIEMIDRYQDSLCVEPKYNIETGERTSNCFTLLDYLELDLSFILLVVGFIFMYFYSDIVRKWKARPE